MAKDVKRGAGKYQWRFTVQSATPTLDPTTGDKPKGSYTPGSTYWGSYSADSADESQLLGTTRTQVSGTVVLAGLVSVTAQDRLLFVTQNETYLIDGVRKDYNAYETICDVTRLDGAT